MADFLEWPRDLLAPYQIVPAPVPFTRSGGRSLGGLKRVTRTDKGFWKISFERIVVHSTAQRRTWTALATELGGAAGLLAVPVYVRSSAPYVGEPEWPVLVPHSDGTPFDDGSLYEQGAIDIRAGTAASIGQTTMVLRRVNASDDLAGVRFSYRHALYQTGRILAVAGDLVTVNLFPAIRAPIPAGAALEFDSPTCLVHLASDEELTLPDNAAEVVEVSSVNFVEAHEYWADLALSGGGA